MFDAAKYCSAIPFPHGHGLTDADIKAAVEYAGGKWRKVHGFPGWLVVSDERGDLGFLHHGEFMTGIVGLKAVIPAGLNESHAVLRGTVSSIFYQDSDNTVTVCDRHDSDMTKDKAIQAKDPWDYPAALIIEAL